MYVCEESMKIKEMRRIYYLLIAGALVFGVTSCNEKTENSEATNVTTENTSETETSTTTSESSGNEVALNPPHGQPGHLCEIPVGQPLPNGGKASSTPANDVQLKTPLMQGNQKLNPPHGQPGHKCEIPVGQPLP